MRLYSRGDALILKTTDTSSGCVHALPWWLAELRKEKNLIETRVAPWPGVLPVGLGERALDHALLARAGGVVAGVVFH